MKVSSGSVFSVQNAAAFLVHKDGFLFDEVVIEEVPLEEHPEYAWIESKLLSAEMAGIKSFSRICYQWRGVRVGPSARLALPPIQENELSKEELFYWCAAAGVPLDYKQNADGSVTMLTKVPCAVVKSGGRVFVAMKEGQG